MKKIILLFSVCAVLMSCQEETSQAKEDYDKTLKEVFAYHDEAMPKMGEIANLIATLEKKTTLETGEPDEELLKAEQRLKQAHDHMMTWMKDFSENFPDVHTEKDLSEEEWQKEKKKLEPEITSAKKMRDDVFESVAYGKKVLGED
ncbi:hypothetical protein RBU60_08505 [Mesonia sp. MT50]|uniref:Viral A-type inclusion protein n=1 Tax=Mesonia profundi TaxID=3070998 RepID=A0ABU1A1N3_9FLAO|nr:hypothetical protein [Mesonia profundi]MDQ7917613.1 hypothetical protein [Mesonia profundi]